MTAFRILPAGDSAIVLDLPPRLDPAVNAWCVSVAAAVRTALGHAVRDVVVGFCTVTVYFDPLRDDPAAIEREVAAIARETAVGEPATGAVIEVPVCYGGVHGPDLADVARFAGLPEATVVERHIAREYRVYLVGFVPGFAYLAAVDETIAAPRRATPRTKVPAGAVAIAGLQTGIYPDESPGGWNIIGRTPVKPYDPARTPAFLFSPGDRVRFRAIDAATFAMTVAS